jgi:hypothetical protein
VRLRQKIAASNYRPPKRIPTHMPKSARRRILNAKTRLGQKKKMRGKPKPEE